MSFEVEFICSPGALGAALPVQCASCPFRDGNDAEWAAVVNRLRVASGLRPVKAGSKVIKRARTAVRIETGMLGKPNFACHGTAYDEKMNIRPLREHRQCPGAVEFIKNLESLKR